jgi:hypothetical protein
MRILVRKRKTIFVMGRCVFLLLGHINWIAWLVRLMLIWRDRCRKINVCFFFVNTEKLILLKSTIQNFLQSLKIVARGFILSFWKIILISKSKAGEKHVKKPKIGKNDTHSVRMAWFFFWIVLYVLKACFKSFRSVK